MSQSRPQSAKHLFQPALILGVGFFCLLSLNASGSESEPNTKESGFQFPKVTFFWQRESFQDRYHSTEALQVPAFPANESDRLLFESIFDRSLAADPERPDASQFEAEFLGPLEPFLIPEDSKTLETSNFKYTLEQALIETFKTNPSIQVRDLQTAVEDERLNQAENVFTPTIELSSEYSESRFPQNASESASNNLFPTIGGEPQRFLSKSGVIEAAVKGENAAGTQYELYSNLLYNKSTLTQRPTALFYEEYTTNAGLRITQPILKNSSKRIREAPIRIARINRNIAYADLRTELTEIANRTLNAYFRWLEAQEIVELRTWEKRTYQQLAETIRSRVETGDASSRELLRIEIRLTRVEDRLLQAEEQREMAKNRLFEQFGPTVRDQSEFASLRPAGEMSPEIPEISLSSTIETALNDSAEIARYRKELERSAENLDVALDEARASLNLVGGVEFRGLDGGPDDSIASTVSDHPMGFNVGIVYSRPWGNDSAEAKVRENRLLVRQSEIELARIQHEVRSRISEHADRLSNLRSRRDNLRSLQDRIGKEIDQENTRLETGQSTLNSLLEFYEELFQVRSQYLGVLAQICETKSELWSTDQSLLKRLGIEYTDALDKKHR